MSISSTKSSYSNTRYNVSVYWDGTRISKVLTFEASNCISDVREDNIHLKCTKFDIGYTDEYIVYEGLIQSYTIQRIEE